MTTLCFVFGRTQGCALSFFVRFSEKWGFCGYFFGVRTLFKGICILQLPALVLANRFKGSGFNLLNYKVVPLLEYYYGNTAQKKVPYIAKCDIINLWINR